MIDILVGKTTPFIQREGDPLLQFPKKDVSVGHRPSESGIVDTVMVTTNEMGYKLVKVRVRQVQHNLLNANCLGESPPNRRQIL